MNAKKLKRKLILIFLRLLKKKTKIPMKLKKFSHVTVVTMNIPPILMDKPVVLQPIVLIGHFSLNVMEMNVHVVIGVKIEDSKNGNIPM